MVGARRAGEKAGLAEGPGTRAGKVPRCQSRAGVKGQAWVRVGFFTGDGLINWEWRMEMNEAARR